MQIEHFPELKSEINRICEVLGFNHIKTNQIFTFKSFGSKTKAIARIWSLPKIWQHALNVKPFYCIEVISEKYDKLNKEDKQKVLIHELLHIPKNFSGALLSHNHNGKVINNRIIDYYYQKFKNHGNSKR